MVSQPVSDVLALFLCSAESDPEFAALPVCNGRLQPLPTALLVALSIQCRIRLRDGLDAAITATHVARGVLETYIRLLFLSPQVVYRKLPHHESFRIPGKTCCVGTIRST